jgi:hypothetical protein
VAGPLDPLVGRAKKAVESALGRLRALAGRIPFLKRAIKASSPEPFSSIEDGSPTSDAVIEVNAAHPAPGFAEAGPRPDPRALVALVVKNKPLFAGTLVLLGFLLAWALTAIVVGLPARRLAPSPALSPEGKALVRRWILPRGPSVEPRIWLEREGPPDYTAQDAIRLGADPAGVDITGLQSRNDAEIEELYRTVR